MATFNNTHWQQWDRQEALRLRELKHIELSNLYLQIERGDVQLTITNAKR